MLSIAAALAAACALASGCAASGTGASPATSTASAPDTSAAPTPEEKTLKIGILQIIEHTALDASRQGFIDGLAEAGYVKGQNIEIDYQNAQGDQSNLKTMSQRLVQNKSDLLLAIATPIYTLQQ